MKIAVLGNPITKTRDLKRNPREPIGSINRRVMIIGASCGSAQRGQSDFSLFHDAKVQKRTIAEYMNGRTEKAKPMARPHIARQMHP